MAEKVCDNCMSRVPADSEKCPKCGIRFENTNPGGALPNGWVLNEQYTIGRYIDIDGEGVIYSAIDGNTLQRVIVKEFMPVTLCATRDESGDIISKPGCEVLFKTTRMDFRELYSSLIRLGLCEGLVQVLDVVEANNTVYAVLEKVEGPTLNEYLTKMSGPLEPAKVLTLLRPVMAGVEALHNGNMIHRGISPDNIILESGGTAKLGGYATLALRQQGNELKPKLYPSYSAPEQYSASEFEGRYTDIYAIGAVLYRMLTGEAPLAADARKMQDTLKAARTFNKEIPPYLSSGIARAMRVTPAERIQDMPALRLALSGEGGSGAGPLGLSRQQMIVGASAIGAIIVLFLVILLVSLFSGKEKPESSSLPVSSSSSMPEVETNKIPDFTNKVYADIIKNPTYTSVFTFAQPTEEYSDKVDEGRIISQNPKAGTEWDGKTAIQFVVSKGAEKAELPNLDGKTREEATRALDALKIKYQIADVANNGSQTADTVVGMQPAAGTMVAINTAQPVVTISIVKDVAQVEMPPVVNLSRDDALRSLRNLGVQNIRETIIPNTGNMIPNVVQRSNIEPFTKFDPRTQEVNIEIADNVMTPSAVGRPVQDVKRDLEALSNSVSRIRVTVKEITDTTVTDKPAGTVTNHTI